MFPRIFLVSWLALSGAVSLGRAEPFRFTPTTTTGEFAAPFGLPDPRGPMVAGDRAVLRDGMAYAPANAPDSVKRAIWATNALRNKPYRWGGGHGSFEDGGYDCSGTVSYALHHAGALSSPMPSSELRHYGERGHGRWFTVYSRRGHAFAVIAGLRLDTTGSFGGEAGPRWSTEMRSASGFTARHPAGM